MTTAPALMSFDEALEPLFDRTSLAALSARPSSQSEAA